MNTTTPWRCRKQCTVETTPEMPSEIGRQARLFCWITSMQPWTAKNCAILRSSRQKARCGYSAQKGIHEQEICLRRLGYLQKAGGRLGVHPIPSREKSFLNGSLLGATLRLKMISVGLSPGIDQAPAAGRGNGDTHFEWRQAIRTLRRIRRPRRRRRPAMQPDRSSFDACAP